MYKLTVLYPASEGGTFDMEYYRTKHKVVCFENLDGLERLEIEQGVEGQPYLAIGHLYFPSLEALQTGLGSPKAEATATDIPNFTNVTPSIQISEVID
jgi:uncharacterized protein (TIGR02118 family)